MAIEINAKARDVKGTSASRRLRRENKVPGVLYGGNGDAVSLEIDGGELFVKFREEAFHASILDLNLEGKKESVLLRDFQLHPVRNTVQHIDFQRVDQNKKIHIKVPFHFINEDAAIGVKVGGGIVARILTEAEVSCLPKSLPEFLEVDVAELDMGQSIHLSEITLPEGVEFVQLAHDHDSAVVSIAKTRGGSSADEDEETTTEATDEEGDSESSSEEE